MSYDDDKAYERRGHYVEVHTSTLNFLYAALLITVAALVLSWMI